LLRLINFLFWLLLVSAFLLMVTLPVSLEAQLAASVLVIATMIALRRLNPYGPWRMLPLALGSVIVLRYAFWRTAYTLPPLAEPENFIPGILLYLAEMYSVVMLALSLFVVSMPMPSRPRVDIDGDEADFPTVDVFIPTYNEPVDLLINTISAAKGLDYPAERFTVWLCDDGATDARCGSADAAVSAQARQRRATLQRVCADFGVNYLTRPDNAHAKSGNLNNAMAHSTGTLVAVFDADHAPARNFLRETVGHFDGDPRLSLVQTPHFFLNPDPVEKNLRTFEKMPGENEMFYHRIQLGLDKWNSTFFCGSAAVLRRAAIDEIGGFAVSSITEDCETSILMHERGWNSVYVDKPMVAGLQPGTFANFIGQRSRWAQGMVQILLLRRPMFRRGLSLPQRICYLSSMLFWFFPFPRLIFALAPLAYLFFNLQIFVASGGEFIAYTIAYMVANLLMQNYLYGDVRRPWFSELYEYAQSLHLFPAVVSALLRPTKPTFRVTAKDDVVRSDRLSEISGPFFVMFGLLLVGFLVTLWRVFMEPYSSDILLIVGGWNFFNLIVAGAALGVVAERTQLTQFRRVKVNRSCRFLPEATGPAASADWIDAQIDDVSVGGAQIRLPAKSGLSLREGATGELCFEAHDLHLSGSLPVTVRSVRSGSETLSIGCEYAPVTPDHHRMVADLIFANSDQWTSFQQQRRRNVGVVRGTLSFIAISVRETLRGMAYTTRIFIGSDRPVSAQATRRPEIRREEMVS